MTKRSRCRLRRPLSLAVLLLAVAGCTVQVVMPEVPATHPAHPDAAAAPLPAPSPLLDSYRPVAPPPEPMPMDHGGMDHDAMQHQEMQHQEMQHQEMQHQEMEHQEMEPAEPVEPAEPPEPEAEPHEHHHPEPPPPGTPRSRPV